MFAGVPSVNSLESIYSFLERPIVQAELNKIQVSIFSTTVQLPYKHHTNITVY